MAIIETFHFLRPEWFWALLPLLLVVVLLARDKAKSGNWQSVVDAELLPHLLIGDAARQRRWPLTLVTLAGLLAITALAGPVWQKLEQPLFRQESSLVVLLDLSRSMDATDSKPSRLVRAKLKLKDLLARRHEGETALIAYAANAFVVTPLTSDTQTIASQLSGLTTDLMPAQGSRPDLAVRKGLALLRQAGRVSGSLLLITDGIEGAPASPFEGQIKELRAEGYKLSLLGVGSKEGAPIPLPTGGFIKDNAGNIVLASLDAAQMQSAVRAGGGLYRLISADESDIDNLLAVIDTVESMEEGKEVVGMKSDQWQEEGAWLLLPLILVALFAFRQGVLLLLLVAVLPVPRESMAAGIDTLWRTQDQQAQQAFEKGESKAAAELFEDPAWRAAAQYKSGEFKKSLEQLQGIEGSDAAYNRGNALAQMGKLEEALKAYEAALEQQPQMEDAAFNRDKVKEWLKEAEQPQEKSDKSSDQQDDGQKGDSEENPSQQEQSKSDSSSQKPGEDKSGEGESSTPSEADKQDAAESEQKDNSSQEAKADANSAEEQAAKEAAEKQLAEQLRQQKDDGPADKDNTMAKAAPELSSEERELEQATEQWLRRIPDDPSGLWRRKFLYQYKNQEQLRGEEEKPW